MSVLLGAFVALLVAGPVWARAPNVLLVLADDLGFSDVAPYGSEINTPTLWRLAERGVRFSNFHTAASCAPSRAMLLTGVDSHRNGVPNMPEALPPEQHLHAHYAGALTDNVVTVAELLRDAGYHTYLSGKWHLGKRAHQLPFSRGFERTVTMADSGSDHWEQRPYLPIYKKANWFENGRPLDLPEDYYSSRFLVDRMIDFIDSNSGDGRPFFAYLPFMAVHTPVQAPKSFSDRYDGVYDDGWDVLRRARQARARELGLTPADAPMVQMSTTGDWSQLDAEARRYQARRMAVYAGMVEAMDFHLGRLLDFLEASGELANTVVIFASDNGPEASGPHDPRSFPDSLRTRVLGYSADLETLGQRGSFGSIGPSFASAAAAPFAYYKFYTGEGGLRVPLIIAGHEGARAGSVEHAFTFVTDITPTILELAGVAAPGATYRGREIEPIVGRSLVPVMRGVVGEVYSDADPVGYELAGNAALFKGDYKIVLNRGPVGDEVWRLFNLARDPGETEDLSATMPERMAEMLADYERYVAANRVLPVPEGYAPVRQVLLNGLRARTDIGLRLVAIAAAVAALLLLAFVWRRSRRT